MHSEGPFKRQILNMKSLTAPGLINPQASIPPWESIFDVMPEGMIVTDPDFTICYVNQAFLELSGKTAQALIGRKCFDAFPGALCHGPNCPLNRAAGGSSHQEFENGAHCKSSSKGPNMVTCLALHEAGRHFVGIFERVSDNSLLQRANIELHRSHERLRKTMGAVIQAISLTIEKRDPYTAGHQRRVAKLCRAIGTEMGLPWGRIQGLRMAAAIHDLGKIHVPAAILNKPGQLSEHEMAIIRQHPQTAYEILRGIEFPWPLAETIYQHHERLDGSGYPRGLKGDEIILEARILGVADVLESIYAFRPYRPGRGPQAAREALRRGRGVLYDAAIVDICETLVYQKGFDFKTKAWQQVPVTHTGEDAVEQCKS
jgi:HD-GYP domain-containing protein (c-di-GMP phosphodiesterase class II)